MTAAPTKPQNSSEVAPAPLGTRRRSSPKRLWVAIVGHHAGSSLPRNEPERCGPVGPAASRTGRPLTQPASDTQPATGKKTA